ncbi:uncharacterized protein FA14DRAFT_182430 [Meira miltonrushii]|uniref:Uncharacterized protein n=1 Tax=Meira miltonrushii TaxID=1280837 RepID=A0A316V259_9BASI|nr:uncharacterized protein FA14DRAFT_182430 [Meira miltonrushii]PWN31639.1 hypothetical protein FA14DRAFT_182430 [Meira miltonrushii]
MEQETIPDVEPPPTPPNGFPDDDEAPLSRAEDAQTPKERFTESGAQKDALSSRITQRENGQRPSIGTLSSSSNRNHDGVRAYYHAANWYVMTGAYWVNDYVRLPGRPDFGPKSSTFSWENVRLAQHPCPSCKYINKSKPVGYPVLPCLASTDLDRCVFCHCTNNRPTSPCNVRPRGDYRHSSVDGNRSRNDFSLMRNWDRTQRPYSYVDTYDRAGSSSNDNRTRRYSEILPNGSETSRANEQSNGQKRRRSEKDEGSERRSSPIRKEATQARMQPPSEVHVYEAPTQNDPSSTPTSVNGTSSTSEDPAVGLLFPNENANSFGTKGADQKQATVPAVVQASSPETVAVKTCGSFCTSAAIPPPQQADDNDADNDVMQLLKKAHQKMESGRLKETKEKEDLKQMASQLQDRYIRINKDLEKLYEKNEELIQENETLKQDNQELKDGMENLKQESENLRDTLRNVRREVSKALAGLETSDG